jgi:hypothetical protein
MLTFRLTKRLATKLAAKSIGAGDVEPTLAATMRQVEQGHLRGDRTLEEELRELLGHLAKDGDPGVGCVSFPQPMGRSRRESHECGSDPGRCALIGRVP